MVNEIGQREPITFLRIINTTIVECFYKCQLYVTRCDVINVFELDIACNNNWPRPEFKNKYINKKR